MPRYAAFLRGVSPLNAKMPALRQAFESAGFSAVTTVLGSGNVVFDARRASETTLQRRAEAAMRERLGQSFLTIVRPVEHLHRLQAADPFRRFRLPPGAKRVVPFFVTEPAASIVLPLEHQGARLLALQGWELFTAYVPGAKGALFMALIERTFGKAITTRTWETVARVARA
jgi:Uncharacterized protein conserved in bacteria